MRRVLLVRVLLALALTGCTDNQLRVVNTAPTAEIQLPTAGASFVQDAEVVVFRGKVGDADQKEEELDVVWLSDRDGTLGDDPPDSDGIATFELPASALSTGDHTVSLTVTDTTGLSFSDETTLTVLPPDEAPQVAIVSPTDGASVAADAPITFVGTAADARDDASDLTFEWSTAADGVFATGTVSGDGEARATATLPEGPQTVTLRVTDTEDNAASATIALTITHVNEPPSATITDPASGDGEKVGRLVTFSGLVQDPEDAPGALQVDWSSDLDGPLGSTDADSSGATSLTTGDLSVGLHAITLTVTDTAGEVATSTINFEVYEQNTPPSPPTIAISPADPRTTDALVVEILADGADEDGDALSYTYQWYRDSALMSGYTADTVAASKTSKHEVWMVEVRSTDGEDESDPAVAEVEVLNTPPALSSASLSPSAPTVEDTLTCTPAGWTDDDGDAAGYVYQWTVDGAAVAETGGTLSGAFSKNQSVGCTVTPDDGDDLGDPVTAASVTVTNTPPVPPVVSIDPAYPTTDDDLTTLVGTPASDADGDALTTTYTWEKDGVVTAYTGSSVAALYTDREETWTLTVTVDDGALSVDSAPVTVRIWPGVGDLLITEFLPDPSAVADARGEWVEIWNNTDTTLSLDDHTLGDYDYDCVDLTGLSLDPGEYLVICVEDDPTTNGGVSCDVEAVWDTGYTSGCNQLALSNSGDELAIENPANTTDAVVYTSAWVYTGKATSLDAGAYDESDNDSSASWCKGTDSLSGGDKGSPGDDNPSCL